jgi:hypothetical protein
MRISTVLCLPLQAVFPFDSYPLVEMVCYLPLSTRHGALTSAPGVLKLNDREERENWKKKEKNNLT